jgi:molybdopterin/thiamine biosynthesis adenylyltransferase
MTTFSATFAADHMEQLRRHLHPGDGCEHAAYVLFNRAAIRVEPWDREAHLKFLSAEVIPVKDDQVIESTPNLISWKTASFIAALKRGEESGQSVAIVHSHTDDMREFSEQDDANEPELMRLAKNRNGRDTPLLSFILTGTNALNGRIWLGEKLHVPLRMIRVIGDAFQLHYLNRGHGQEHAAFQRQALAFGMALNENLAMLRIGVVGCGGTGSAVAMLLGRLGVGQLTLIDNDIVDRTNLNRLHGARQSDADAMRPKVEVVARSITELGLGVRVVPIEAWVGDPGCRDAVRACDIIFGCTDDHEGRMFLNRLAVFYRIPLFDTGLLIRVSKDDPPEIESLDGRVSVLLPSKTCLSCRGTISAKQAADEALRRSDPTEFERRKAEAYVFGAGNPSPAVVTFTTEVATMAVNELLHRLQGYRGAEGAITTQVRQFHRMEDFRPGAKPQPGCPICDDAGYWGRGDTDPFLDRS